MKHGGFEYEGGLELIWSQAFELKSCAFKKTSAFLSGPIKLLLY